MNTESRKILVVDDEESIRNILQRILESIGYEVITASDGREALYKLQLGEARIVLMDINMPNLSGSDVLRKLGNDVINFCIIIITVVTDMQIAVNALNMGAMDYITKPFDQDEVIDKLYRAIEKYNRTLSERKRYEQLQANSIKQTERMREQFNELIGTQAREHDLLSRLSARQTHDSNESPPETGSPAEEFSNAIYRVLKKGNKNSGR